MSGSGRGRGRPDEDDEHDPLRRTLKKHVGKRQQRRRNHEATLRLILNDDTIRNMQQLRKKLHHRVNANVNLFS